MSKGMSNIINLLREVNPSIESQYVSSPTMTSRWNQVSLVGVLEMTIPNTAGCRAASTILAAVLGEGDKSDG